MTEAPPDDHPCLLWIRGHPVGAACASTQQLANYYIDSWKDGLHVEIKMLIKPPGLGVSDALLQVSGIHARPLAALEAGTHLFCPTHGNLVPVRVDVLERWPAEPNDSFAFGPILRTYMQNAEIIDLRTGLVAPASAATEAMHTFVLAALPAA